MDMGYEIYCLADRWFYESPVIVRGDDVDFALAERPTPDGWRRAEFGDWLAYFPDGIKLAPQGWKIHVSACVDNAEEALHAVWDHCVAAGVAFKFVRSRQLYFLRNVKYAPRDSSGKLAAIFPADDAQLEAVLRALDARLGGAPGPYILSDLRWGAGPLYVRYGGFDERFCVGPDGELEPAMEDASGRLVPDRRGTTFQVPDWVDLPACLVPHLEARNSATVQEIPYRIEGALHFSNGGGVYEGVDERSEDRVVLKEARPHAGLSVGGEDAVTRLAHERHMLERLSGLVCVPELRDHFLLGDHHFIVEDFVEGETLNSMIVDRCPLLSEHIDPAAAATYTEWALDVHARVEAAVEALHARGVVIGDLHPDNVLVRPDGSVALIDLEVATGADEERRPTLANPAFVAPNGTAGIAGDHYALACLRLFLFIPLTTLLAHDLRKADDLAAAIADLLPVPPAFLDEAVRVIAEAGKRMADPPPAGPRPPAPEPDPDGWHAARRSLIDGILASATPQRADRLFPGDVKGLLSNGLNLAYGAAGVLHAIHATGGGRHPEHEEWLLQRALHPEPGMTFGLYDGLHGVAHVLDHLGRRDDALAVTELCAQELNGKWAELGDDLTGGLSGIALCLADLARATGEAALWARAWDLVDIVAGRLGTAEDVGEISGGDEPYAGLTRGSSGPALLFLRMFEHSAEEQLLDLAATAIEQDLRRCIMVADDTLEVDEGWRTLPYLADGSAGIAMVVDDYLAFRDDERFAAAAPALRRAALGQFYIEPGLMYGRAGMLLYLTRQLPPGQGGQDAAVAAHVRRLGWHALSYKGHLAFPGEYLMRLSMDLASGSAGVLLALGAALHDEPVHLPFLRPASSEHRADPASKPLSTMERR